MHIPLQNSHNNKIHNIASYPESYQADWRKSQSAGLRVANCTNLSRHIYIYIYIYQMQDHTQIKFYGFALNFKWHQTPQVNMEICRYC